MIKRMHVAVVAQHSKDGKQEKHSEAESMLNPTGRRLCGM
jgi:hypothetical protein